MEKRLLFRTKFKKGNLFKYDTLSLADKVPSFATLNTSSLLAFKRACSLTLSTNTLITLQKYFIHKKIVPSLLEILIIDDIWSDYSYNNRVFNQVELECKNPHIFSALQQYRELRKQTEDNMPTSGIDVINIGFAHLAQNRGDIYSIAGDKHYFAFDAVNKVYKKRCWLSVRTRINRFSHGETIADGLIKNILHEQGTPLQVYRKEFTAGMNTRANERALPFASFCSRQGISAYAEDSIYNEDFTSNYELIISINLHDKIENKKIKSHDKLLLIYPQSDEQNVDVYGNSVEALFKNKDFLQYNTVCVSCKRNIVASCLDFNFGVDIYLQNIAASKNNTILETPDGTLIAVVKQKYVAKITACIKESGCSVSQIGEINNNATVRIFDEKNCIVNLGISMLKYHTPKYTKAVIKDKDIAKEVVTVPDKNLKAYILDSIAKNKLSKNEVTDFSIGGVVFAPYGGSKGATPTIAHGVIPEINGIANEAVISTVAHSSSKGSTPFISAINVIITAISQLVATGVASGSIAVSVSSLFGYIGNDCDRGDLLESRLGELYCQNALSIANIGGSTASYKGSNEIHSIATAVGTAKTSSLISNVFRAGQKLFLLKIPRDRYKVPDFKYLLRMYNIVNINIITKNIEAATVTKDNVVNSVIMALLGSGSGFSFAKIDKKSFAISNGDLIISLNDTEAMRALDCEYLGVVDDSGIIKGVGLSLFQSEVAKKLTVNDEQTSKKKMPQLAFYRDNAPAIISSHKINSPRVFIPKIFSSTDSFVKEFAKAGARPTSFSVPLANIDDDLIIKIRKRIEESEILALCTPSIIPYDKQLNLNAIELLSSPIIRDAINELLFRRDGLIIGIGEGMRTLMQLGYLPFGKIADAEQYVKMTKNIPSGYTSCIAKVKVFSDKGPWLRGLTVGEVYSVPISINDGRIVGKVEAMRALMNNGQIPTIFVDNNGYPAMQYPFNPLGSAYGVESLISPDGRIFGRISFSKNMSSLVNVAEPLDLGLFNRGVNYFK